MPGARGRQAEPPARLGLPAEGGRPGGPGRRRRGRDRLEDGGAQGHDDGDIMTSVRISNLGCFFSL